jgi:prepilin-type N-terminal cleavage/methylation domain-containing protein
MQKESGFTLAEVMVVIAIIAALAALAVPNFVGWLPGYKLKSAVMELENNLQLARLRAIKTNGNCSLGIDTGNDSYTIDCTNRTVDLGNYGEVRFGAADGDTLTFTSRGLTDSGLFTLNVTNNSETFQIRISPTGSIASEKL